MNGLSDDQFELSYRSLFEYSQDAVYFLDLDGHFVKVNKSCEMLCGFSEAEMVNVSFVPFVNEDDLPHVVSCFKNACDGISQNFSTTITHKNGSKVHIRVTNVPIIVDGNVIGVFGVAKDVTVETTLALRLQEIEQNYNFIEQNLSSLVLTVGTDGVITHASASHLKVLGYTPEQLENGSALQLIYKDDRTFVQKIFRTMVKNKEGSRIETRWRRKSGELLWFENDCRVILDESRHVKQIMIFSTDITERKNSEMHYKHMALHDALTGLSNRRAFLEKLGGLLSSVPPSDFSILFLDCDKFKCVNDAYGHNVGDLVLKEFGHKIESILPKRAYSFRYAGDEFTILMENTKQRDAALQLAQSILQTISGHWRVDGHSIAITTSVGIAHFPGHGCTVDELVKSADSAMYAAKSAGGNTYRIAALPM